MSNSASDRSRPPASPCINVCVLGAEGYCLGCGRTGDEIARWRDMGLREQWQLIDVLAKRSARRVAPAAPPDGGSNES